jgi:hypothetical protein
MDTVTLAFVLRAPGIRQTLLSFDYGQRHCRALALACSTAQRLDAPHHTVDFLSASTLLTGRRSNPWTALCSQPATGQSGQREDTHRALPALPPGHATAAEQPAP